MTRGTFSRVSLGYNPALSKSGTQVLLNMACTAQTIQPVDIQLQHRGKDDEERF